MANRGALLVITLITFDAMGSDKYPGFLPAANRAKNREVLARGLTSIHIEAAGVDICHGTDLLSPLHGEQSQALSSEAVLRGATVTAARLLKQEQFLGQAKDERCICGRLAGIERGSSQRCVHPCGAGAKRSGWR